MANAVATNKNAIVFNPAIPNYEIYGLGSEPYTATATSYVMTGEVLSSAYIAGKIFLSSFFDSLLFSNMIKDPTEFVFQSRPFWETWWFQNESWEPKDDHSMDAIIALWED